MKKLLLTLLTTCIIFTTAMVHLSAEETEITKDYLKTTLQMSDEEIIGSGLAYVYEVGDVISIPMDAKEDIDAGRENENFTITKDTKWDMHFVIADKGKDQDNYLTLISVEALPIGKVSIDDGTNVGGIVYEDNWIHSFLNEKLITMFPQSVQHNLASYYRPAYKITTNGENPIDIKDANLAKLPASNTACYIWIPSAKELGFGATYTINQGTAVNVALPTVGKYQYANYASVPHALTALLNEEQANFWLREDFYQESNYYFLATSNEGLTHNNRNTDKNAVIIGFDVKWSKDRQNGTTINEEVQVNTDNTVNLETYVPSTYEISLPETVTLTGDFTQFQYVVKGDLEKNAVVKVEFPETSFLKFTGGFTKQNIKLNIFNDKVTYDRADCNKTATGTVSIKNEKPTAGTWSGTLPVTISIE